MLDSSMHGLHVYPEWLETGSLTPLMPELFPLAWQIYVIILYVKWKEVDLLAVAEPLIAVSHARQDDFAEVYLRLFAAVAHHDHNNDARAREHICAATELALPLGIITPFIENRFLLSDTMDSCLKEKYPRELAAVKKNTQPFMDTWSRLYAAVWDKTIFEGLTQREFEVCALASRGMLTEEIAWRTRLSKSTVKKYLNSAYHKLGVKGKKHLPALMHP